MIDRQIDIGINETLDIEENSAEPYFVLWPFGHGLHYGNAYGVVVEESGGGWRISAPAMPGFVGTGATRDRAKAQFVSAIKAYLYRLKGFLDEAKPLIPRYIGPDPNRPGEGNVVVVPEYVSVWVLISAMQSLPTPENAHGYFDRLINDAAIHTVARNWEIPDDAVRAAVGYYYWHKIPIDARIETNDAAA